MGGEMDKAEDDTHPYLESESVVEQRSGGGSLTELGQYEPYVKPGFAGMFQNKYILAISFIVRLGGFLFGYDQVQP